MNIRFACKLCGNAGYYFDHMVLQQLWCNNCWELIWPAADQMDQLFEMDDENIFRVDLL